MKVTEYNVAEYVQQSTEASGVPVRVTSEQVLLDAAGLVIDARR